MSLHSKIQDSLHSGIRLLGEIPISDLEYEELLAYTRKKVEWIGEQTIYPQDLLLSMALVQIAIRAYEDGNYWDSFEDEIGVALPVNKKNYIGRIFRETLKRNSLFLLEKENASRYQYVENIKAHSFVPNNYLFGYYEFLFAFYDKTLLRQIPEDLDDELDELSVFFENTLREGGDSFSIERGGNRAPKAYKLLKATREVLAQGRESGLSNLLREHLFLIDKFYYEDKLPPQNNRFEKAFTDWAERTEEIDKEERKRSRKRSEVFYRRPYLRIDRENAQPLLVIPSQKIRKEDFTGEIAATIYINGKKEDLYYLAIYSGIINYATEEIEIPINNPFAEIGVEISTRQERFRIPAKPFRLFDEDFYEIRKLRSGQNYLCTEKGRNVKYTKCKLLYCNDRFPLWDEFSFPDVTDKTVIYVDNEPISIDGGFTAEPVFEYVPKDYLLLDESKQLQIAYKHPNLSFKVHKDRLNKTIVWVNQTKLYAEDDAASIVDLPNENGFVGVTIRINDIIYDDEGTYRIVLEEPAEPKKEICSYVLLPGLRVFKDRPRYTFAQEAIITVKGGYDIEPVNCRRIDDLDEYVLDLTTGEERAEFKLNLPNGEYSLVVPLNVFKYGFEKKWRYIQPSYIWHADIKNDLYVSIPGASEAIVFIDYNGRYCGAQGIRTAEGEFRFDLTGITDSLRQENNIYDNIILRYTDNKQRQMKLFKVLNRSYISKADVLFTEGAVPGVEIDYEGKNPIVISFCDYSSGDEIVKKTVSIGHNDFPELDKHGYYVMHIYEEIADEFGFGSELRELGRPKYGIGLLNPKDISNCKIVLEKTIVEGYELELNYSYEISVREKLDECTYIGKLTEKALVDAKGINTIDQNVYIECIVDEGQPIIISVQTKDEDDEVFDPLYYDAVNFRLIKADECSDHDYERYLLLYDDVTDFVCEIRRNK